MSKTSAARAVKAQPKTAAKTLKRSHAKPKARTRRRDLEPRAKVSVVVDRDDLKWATQVAEITQVSLSAVFAEALAAYKRHRDLKALLELLGGVDDITPEERAQFKAERAAVGWPW